MCKIANVKVLRADVGFWQLVTEMRFLRYSWHVRHKQRLRHQLCSRRAVGRPSGITGFSPAAHTSHPSKCMCV